MCRNQNHRSSFPLASCVVCLLCYILASELRRTRPQEKKDDTGPEHVRAAQTTTLDAQTWDILSSSILFVSENIFFLPGLNFTVIKDIFKVDCACCVSVNVSLLQGCRSEMFVLSLDQRVIRLLYYTLPAACFY